MKDVKSGFPLSSNATSTVSGPKVFYDTPQTIHSSLNPMWQCLTTEALLPPRLIPAQKQRPTDLSRCGVNYELSIPPLTKVLSGQSFIDRCVKGF